MPPYRMHRSQSTVLLVLLLWVYHGAAFTISPGPSCSTFGEPCSYVAEGEDGHTYTLNGACAPDLYCADNGAAGTSDDEYYEYCGSDGICGGLNAFCSNTNPFVHEQVFPGCYTPKYTCNLSGETGTCGLSPTGVTRRRAQEQLAIGPTSCRRPTDELCVTNGRAECVNVSSDFGNCGGCGKDCGATEGADTVECQKGVCVIQYCRRGWIMIGNACVRSASGKS
ncbi:hypothetical protein CALCODRAFT_91204 [Calocera cornea HHB12733]|uniref:Protein CPL1-like domain-containing protein n=1 Tax=Calocera cornea HHB12733 TaxID=1353952 RepID=A0A165DAV3_9BASI|nr:hypothetical protein CALCODRAFT_91204 [Calocera cornea HHB12733]